MHIRMGIKALSGLCYQKRLVILNSCHNVVSSFVLDVTVNNIFH